MRICNGLSVVSIEVTVVVSVTARENSASNACICSVCEHVLCSSVHRFVFLGKICALFDGHRGSGTRNCKHVRTEKSCRRDAMPVTV